MAPLIASFSAVYEGLMMLDKKDVTFNLID